MLGKIKLPSPPMNRRFFLKAASLSGAGFVVGCSSSEDAAPVAEGPSAAPAADMPPAAMHDFNPFVKIDTDNNVTVIVKHLDKGQGVTTGLPTIIAEELDAAWSQMKHEFAPVNTPVYENFVFHIQGTGGSSSIANSWMQYRQAAAAARAMLVDAAAARWQVPAAEISVSDGVVSHGDNSATFGELAADAATQTPPESPTLKDPSEFKLIGTKIHRLDSNAKTDGTATFTLDAERPGMLIALVAHAPMFGAKVASFDASAAKAIDGVSDVVQIPTGVAVLADNFWSAKKGRDALSIEWDESDVESRSSDAIHADFEAAIAAGDGIAARNDGDASGALASAGKTLSAEYRFPYLSHATMEPMNIVIELSEDKCEMWFGSQLQTVDQGTVASIVELPPENVFINTLFAGGSFGRRAVPTSDYIAEAAHIVKAIDGKAPVKLLWTREDDMQAGFYRPLSSHTIQAGLDSDGNITGWQHKAAAQSIFAGTPFSMLVQNGLDPSIVEGSSELPYAIPNVNVQGYMMDGKVPVLWWRSVGHSQNAFVVETFFDEVAKEAGKDPVALRLEMLKDHPRHTGVLKLVAEKAGWGEDPGPGRGRGVAVHESFGSVVAEIVDVTVADDGSFSVDKVWCAVDCGIAINPDIVVAQMEGGIGYGLSAALREGLMLDGGKVMQSNFDTYRSLRINEMPEIEVHIVKSGNAPTGVGEPGLPPLAPALANALADATGKRIRKLPIADQLKA